MRTERLGPAFTLMGILLVAGCSAGAADGTTAAGAGGTSDSSGSGAVAGTGSATPPPASALPDGGTTPDGGPAPDADRLVTQLQWFTGLAATCTVNLSDSGVTRKYSTAKLSLTSVPEGKYQSLTYTLGGGAGASSTDTYSFPISLGADSTIKIEVKSGETDYSYSSDVGWSQSLRLVENASSTFLWTYNADGHVEISCQN